AALGGDSAPHLAEEKAWLALPPPRTNRPTVFLWRVRNMLHRKSLYLALAVVAAIGTASTADAQGPRQGGFGRGGGGGFGTDPFSLLNNPAIRSELGIDQDQAQKLNELRQQMEEE